VCRMPFQAFRTQSASWTIMTRSQSMLVPSCSGEAVRIQDEVYAVGEVRIGSLASGSRVSRRDSASGGFANAHSHRLPAWLSRLLACCHLASLKYAQEVIDD
jgi:hypothetical protein